VVCGPRGRGQLARYLAWAAAYMLTEESLPRMASGRRGAAVGRRTSRPVDDVGLVTNEGEWVVVTWSSLVLDLPSKGGPI
jgi:hypothetical protein